ncbi:LacI family DNA-binding transcriptional regulator [Virgisporangium aurantiacum]|uniref:LacI family transcriptional regulator n=1 Tax=Virgisporangium aurantiacum TaxID=175570 RepID=A0A8J3Z3K9_9ACTN|nr:LacI family DNA-binding transcriptional regulator [Virgisporangium aurantiacum]GIJ56974.1 LacI family transcriptional regulator [Virgisporangium aurantiacum]
MTPGPPGRRAGEPTDGPGPRGRATLRDVALLAGVSPKTVSRVVNGEAGVSPDKVTAVQKAVAMLGYRPNFTASSLRRTNGRTAAIAAVLENVANPFSSALHRALEDVARDRNVVIFTGSVDEDPERERALINAFTTRQADALVIMPASDNQRYLAKDIDAATPVVFVDRPPVGIDADAVLVDNASGAATAVHHLVARGHRDIAYLGDLCSIATARQRFQGFKEALSDHGIRPTPDHLVHDLHTEDDAEQAVRRLLTGDAPPTALFTSQNLVTIGAVRALRGLGHEHRVALVGFDDFPLADLLQPPVTVVAQDPSAMGTLAASLIFRRLDGEDWQPTTHFVPTRLIQRGSGEIPGPHA